MKYAINLNKHMYVLFKDDYILSYFIEVFISKEST